jgi:hypothetical protein
MAFKEQADVGSPKWTKSVKKASNVPLTGAVAGAVLPLTKAGSLGGYSSGGSTGGGGGSSSSGSGYGGSGYEYEGYGYGGGGGDYFDASSVYMEYLNRLQEQAQAAYDRNMATLNDTYERSMNNLRSNYDSTRGQLEASRNKSMNDINTDSEAAMRQAYINNMLSRRDLQQRLTAQGMSGGASETTRASLENNYGNARNQIDTTRGKNLSDLNETYNNNLAAALQQYNSQMSNLDMQKMQIQQQIENALTDFQSGYAANFSMLAPSNEAYLSALRALQNNQANFSFNGATANNPYIAANLQQASNGVNSNYGEYLAQQILNNSTSTAAAKNALYNAYRNGQIGQEDLVNFINRL